MRRESVCQPINAPVVRERRWYIQSKRKLSMDKLGENFDFSEQIRQNSHFFFSFISQLMVERSQERSGRVETEMGNDT